MGSRSSSDGESGSNCAGCCLACGICRILCFKGCKTIFPCCFTKPPPVRPEHSVICVGLSGAGKSTLLGLLAGEVLPETVEPTVGFAMKTVFRKEAIFNIKELGGSETIRRFWDKYYSGHEALIFVVDGSAEGEQEAIAFRNCLENSSLQGVPTLVVCNKMDSVKAKTIGEWVELLELDGLCQGRYHQVVESSRSHLASVQEALDRLAHELYSPP